LGDAGWREEIARSVRVSKHSQERPATAEADYCWIEIGAGHGEMTEYLAATGAPVYAVEVDPPLIAGLQKMAKRFANLTVVAGDVLKTDLAAIAQGRRVKVYGNLPYYITSPILHHCFESADLIDEIYVLIQLEVAERLAARPGTRDYGYLSVVTQYFSRAEILLAVPPGAFQPPPEVDSAVVSLRLPGATARLGPEEEKKFLQFVKQCFAQKRKTLVNNLKGFRSQGAVKSALDEMELPGTARAEELSVERLREIFGRVAAEGF
jgi:16S rRNA (adenine1518-N6/adenine1519-N6)-dimethyltransferase